MDNPLTRDRAARENAGLRRRQQKKTATHKRFEFWIRGDHYESLYREAHHNSEHVSDILNRLIRRYLNADQSKPNLRHLN